MRIDKRIRRKISGIAERVRQKIALSGSGCLVLLYHRVIDVPLDPQLLSVTPERFKEQLLYLKKNYRVLTPQEFFEILQTKKAFPPNSSLITFDDGYEDNVTHALPILEQTGLSALFFVVSGYIGKNREFWWDELERVLLSKEAGGISPTNSSINIRVPGYPSIQATLDTDTNRHLLYRKMMSFMKILEPAAIEDILDQLAASLKVERSCRPTHRPMTVEQLKRLSASGHALIGSHTKNHPRIASQTLEIQLSEWQSSKEELESLIGKSVRTASYPFGWRSDCTKKTKKVLQKSGFDFVFAGYAGKAKSGSDIFELPRLLIRNWTSEELSKELPSREQQK